MRLYLTLFYFIFLIIFFASSINNCHITIMLRLNSLTQCTIHVCIFLQCCVEAVCILHAFPHTSSNQRQKGATDSTMIASGPIAAQWCADKAGGQQRPCSVLRENVIAELSTEGTKGLKRKEFTCELIRLADYRAKIEDVIRKSSNPISLENLYTILTTTSYSFLKNSINEGERDFGLKINIIWIYKAVPVSVICHYLKHSLSF